MSIHKLLTIVDRDLDIVSFIIHKNRTFVVAAVNSVKHPYMCCEIDANGDWSGPVFVSHKHIAVANMLARAGFDDILTNE